MCDIVDLKCEGCGLPINTHIGDFSAARRNVHAFCPTPKCRAKAIELLVGTHESMDYPRHQFIVFADVPEKRSDVCDMGTEGRAFLFIVDMPHRIECNG